MRHEVSAFVLACLVASVPQTAFAQAQGSVELGFDLGVDIGLESDFSQSFGPFGEAIRTKVQITTADLPVTQFRLGFFLSDYVQLQTNVGFAYLYDMDAGRLEAWSFSGGVLGNFGFRPATSISPFVQTGFVVRSRPGVLIDPYIGFILETSVAEMGIPFQAGLRLPISDRAALRLQSGTILWLRSQSSVFFDEKAHAWSIPIQVGLSFYAL